MRGKWELTKDELKYWQATANGQTEAMIRNDINIVDLSRADITPYQVDKVLTSLGWISTYEEEGNNYDCWTCYSREGNYRDIIVYFCGLTFELAVYLRSDMEEMDFKKEHALAMLS